MSSINPIIAQKLNQDLEFNGSMSKAAENGAAFSLLLSMLEQDATKRIKIYSEDKVTHDELFLFRITERFPMSQVSIIGIKPIKWVNSYIKVMWLE